MKGGHGHGARRGWDGYVLTGIIVLVIGCGTLAGMGLHWLKDTRNLNLLLKQKDDQILHLNLLLQKERAKMQEFEKKTKEMKMQMYNLRAQKQQLDGKLLEMQSTILSLKEEQRTIELAFEEKQNETKLLRERYTEMKDQIPQVKSLTETLRQKEAEIEDLKHRLASKDEPSIVDKANVSSEYQMMTDQSQNKTVNRESYSRQSEYDTKMIIKNEPRDEERGARFGERETGGENVNSRKMSKPQDSDDQESSRIRRFRLMRRRQGYLKRPKGQRFRGKPRNEDNIRDSIIGLRMQNESVSKNQQFGENNGENAETSEMRNVDGEHDNNRGRGRGQERDDVVRKNADSENVQMEVFEESEVGTRKSSGSGDQSEEDKEQMKQSFSF